jgi:hypothetical protein
MFKLFDDWYSMNTMEICFDVFCSCLKKNWSPAGIKKATFGKRDFEKFATKTKTY